MSTYRPPPGFERLRLELSWDGRRYAGWQSQPSAPSVQDTLHAALHPLMDAPSRPVAAGRTDAGVHAECMVAHIDVRRGSVRPALAQLTRAVNAHLPPDVALLSAAPAPEGFHARFSCTQRAYVYRVLTTAQRHPLWEGRALHLSACLDIAAMHEAAAHLVGQHDFAAFATQEERQSVRQLEQLDVQVTPAQFGAALLEFHVSGESFLRHMVRGLVGTLLLVGAGKRRAAAIPDILASRERQRAGANVPPHGLYFSAATYSSTAPRLAAK